MTSRLEKKPDNELFPVKLVGDEIKEEDFINRWGEYVKKGYTPAVIVNMLSKDLRMKPSRIRSRAAKFNLLHHTRVLYQDIKEDLFKEKVPLLKEIVGNSLEALKKWTSNIVADEERLIAFTPAEVQSIATMAKSTNDLLRLELGQATEKIDVTTNSHISFTDTAAVLEKLKILKKIDPVSSYPELDYVSEDTDGE